jgi:hypothetical protein
MTLTRFDDQGVRYFLTTLLGWRRKALTDHLIMTIFEVSIIFPCRGCRRLVFAVRSTM